MVSPEQTASAPMPEYPPLNKPVVGEVDGVDKLKIFVDLYFWCSGHLTELYVSIAESLGLRERPLSSRSNRVRWTCVSLAETQRILLGLQLIEVVRFAVAVCTMTLSSKCLPLLKLYKSIWIIQTRNLPIPHAVQIRLFRITLIQMLHPIGLSEPRTLKSVLFKGGRQHRTMRRFASLTLTSWPDIVPKHTHFGFHRSPMRPHVDGNVFTYQHSMYLLGRIHRTPNFSYISRRDIPRREVYSASSYRHER